MPSITSWRISKLPDCWRDGVPGPLVEPGTGDPRDELIVGCDRRLNMDVMGGGPEKVVWEGWRGGRFGDGFILRDAVAADVGDSEATWFVPLRSDRGSALPGDDI